jgi:hypothetical protein
MASIDIQNTQSTNDSVESLVEKLKQLHLQNPSRTLIIDPKILGKSIPFLNAVGTSEAKALKKQIEELVKTTAKPKKEKPEGFLQYPSIQHGKLYNDDDEKIEDEDETPNSQDYGAKHGPNSEWLFQCKLDGSQCSFAWCADKPEGDRLVMFCGSSFCIDNCTFIEAKKILTMLSETGILNPKLMYHGEFISKPQHNVVVYERIPRYYIALYDIQEIETKRWFNEDEIQEECNRTGFEKTQCFWDNRTCKGTAGFLVNETNSTNGKVNDPIAFAELIIDAIEKGLLTSTLGGKNIEGTVFKHRTYYNIDKKITTCRKRKYVTKQFKEKQKKKGKKLSAPKVKVSEYIDWIGHFWDVPARFRKAYQRLRDSDRTLEEKAILAHSMEFLHASLDADFEKESIPEVSAYLQGDFPRKCLKAHSGDQNGIDIKDKWFQRFKDAIKAHGVDNSKLGYNLWLEFKAEICAAARQSFDTWANTEETKQWINYLFGF